MTLDLQTTVGDLVKERPARSRVFESLKIDYCCGGKRSLAEACEKHELDPRAVLQHLRESDAQPAPDEAPLVDADSMSLTDLADHIEQTHHEYLKAELPRLDGLKQLAWDLHQHIHKENNVLFPKAIRFESELAARRRA